jgi:hypothetical protein
VNSESGSHIVDVGCSLLDSEELLMGGEMLVEVMKIERWFVGAKILSTYTTISKM